MGLGKTYSTQYLLDSNNSSGAAGQVLSTTSTGIDWADANTLPGAGLWLESGNDIYNSNSGNVGIGTTSPGGKLEVDGTYGDLKIGDPSVGTQITYYDTTRILMNSTDIKFYTNSLTERMTIELNGNVGIGTTSPTSKLQVSGSGNESVEIKVSAGTTAGNTGSISLSRTDGSGNIIQGAAFLSGGVPIGGIAGGVVGSSNTSAPAFAIQTPNSTNGHIVFNPKGTEKMRITSTGNVGIGTTGPEGILQIARPSDTVYDGTNDSGQSNIGASVTITNTNTTVNSFAQINMQVSASSNRAVGRIVTIARGNASSDMAFVTESFGVRAEKMRIDQTGNVGIGTTSPISKLQVGEVLSSNKLTIGGFYGLGGGHLAYRSGHGSNSSVWDTAIISATDDGNYNGKIEFKTTNSGGNTGAVPNTKMIIKANGNVGIGTTSPLDKLHVFGAVRADLKLEGSYTGGTTDVGKFQYAYAPRGGDTNNRNIAYISGYNTTTDSTSGGYIQIATRQTNGTMQPRIRIEQDGDVGIGTTSPDGSGWDQSSTVLHLYKNSTSGGLLALESSNTKAIINAGNNQLAIFTTTDDPMRFGANGSESMRIISGGNVGIGTTTPAAKLSLYNATEDVSINVNTGTGGSYPKKTGISFGATSTSLGGDAEFTGGAGIQAINTAASNNITDLAFWTTTGGSPTERMRIDSSGNVGIGETSPDTTLDVVGGNADSVVDTLTLKNDSTGNSAGVGINFVIDGLNDIVTSAIYGQRTGSAYHQGSLKFLTKDSAGGGLLERMRIESDGQVSLRTAGAHLMFQNTAGTAPYIANAGTGYADLTIATGGLERMRIDGSGNVGIGTTSPDVRLEVVEASPTDGIVADFVNSTNAGGTIAAIKLSNADSEACDVVLGANRVGANFGSDFFISPSDGVDGTNQERLRITEAGAVKFNAYNSTNNTGTPTYLLGTDASGNIVKTNTVPGSGAGPYLPLAGGTMTGQLFMGSAGGGTFSNELKFTNSAYVAGIDYQNNGNLRLIDRSNSRVGAYINLLNGEFAAYNTGNVITTLLNANGNSYLNGGNVGIGTTSPDSLLHVSADVTGANTGTITIEGRPTGFLGDDIATIDFHNNGSKRADIRMERGNAADDSQLVFSTSDTGTLNDALIINEIGNVGIGTTSPTAKLQVAGTTTYNSDSAQALRVCDATDVSKGIHIGFDTVVNAGIIQAGDFGVAYGNLSLNPNAGNVGIGTTSPNNKLDVNGDVFINSNYTANVAAQDLTIGKTTTGDHGLTIVTGNANTASIFFGDNNNNDAGMLKYQHSSNSMQFVTNRSEKMRIASNGNVGIGTTNPVKQLVVRGSAPWIRLEEDSASNKRLDLWVDPTSAIGYIGANQSAQQLSFQTGNSDRIRILNNGNVGIGTTNPAFPLQVTSANVVLCLDDSNAALNKRRRFFQNNDQTLYFGRQDDNGANNVYDMLISPTGNVGIGTTSPSYQLDVVSAGNALLSLTGVDKPVMRFMVGTSTVGTIQAQENNSMNVSAYGTSSLNLQTVGTTPRLTILTGGNVGIGTTSPQEILHLSQTAHSDEVQILVENTGYLAGAKSSISFSTKGTSGTAVLSRISNQQEGSSAGTLVFDTNSSERMRITSGGNVGIGTISPATQLEISNINDNPATLRLSSDLADGDLVGAIISFSNDAGGGGVQGRIENVSTEDDTTVFKFYTDNTSSPSMTLFDSGNMTIAGTLTQNSDVRLKENIKPIESALDKVKQMQGVEFNKINSSTKEIGVVAQEIEKIIPELVLEDKEGIKSVAYGNITAVLIEAIKEQQKQIEELKQQLNK